MTITLSDGSRAVRDDEGNYTVETPAGDRYGITPWALQHGEREQISNDELARIRGELRVWRGQKR